MPNNIIKVAQLYDERYDMWSDVYEVDSIAGKRIRVEVPRDVREPSNVRKHLLKKGADISDLDHARGDLIAAIAMNAPVSHRAGNVGWRDDSNAFVSFLHVAGPRDQHLLSPVAKELAGALDCRGTLAEWQDLIDSVRYSTAMLTSLCTTFAAPLMAPLNCSNFGIVLVGPSGCAKTTAQLIAASAYGFGKAEDLPTPKATEAGLNEIALFFNDHMLPLDELGTLKGGRHGKDEYVYGMTYSLLSGRDTIRHSSFSASNGAARCFKVLINMSSEFSPDEWAARAGQKRDPGETRRLMGVPVVHGDKPTTFDTFPENVKVGDRGAWIHEQLSRLRDGLPCQRGVPYKIYLDKLTADRETFVAHASEDAADFRSRLSKYAVDPIAADIIAKFGVIYAGGRAAADARVLRFDKRTIFRAVRRSCIAALNLLPNAEADLRKDLLLLKELLESAGVIDADEASTKLKRNMHEADGYYQKAGLGLEYTLRADWLKSKFPSLLRANNVIDWLDVEGFLRHQRARKIGVGTEWAQTHKTWVGGQRHRSFVLYFPGSLDVLDLDN